MKCPGCLFENESEKKFCIECGKKLALQCPECKSELKGIEKVCGECGHDATGVTVNGIFHFKEHERGCEGDGA